MTRPEHAEELADVLKGMLCHVNLIPVNHVPERNYVRTPREDIFEFQRIWSATKSMQRSAGSKDMISQRLADNYGLNIWSQWRGDAV